MLSAAIAGIVIALIWARQIKGSMATAASIAVPLPGMALMKTHASQSPSPRFSENGGTEGGDLQAVAKWARQIMGSMATAASVAVPLPGMVLMKTRAAQPAFPPFFRKRGD